MAEISDLVPVTISYSDSRGVVRREFQSLLALTSGIEGGKLVVDIQPSGAGKVLQIDNIGDARIAFREGSEALELAISYFEMRPVPRSPLYVGRYNSEARHFEYRGGGEAGNIAAMKAITAGEFTLNGVTFTALDLSAATITDEDDVATAIQTLINANLAFTEVRVTWDSERTLFFITSIATGTSDIAEGWISTSDIAAEDTTVLGLDNGVLIRESVVETIPEALRRIRESNRDWHFVMPTKEIPANDLTAHDEITEWAQTQDDPITPLIRIGDNATLSKTIGSEGVTLFNTQRGSSVIWDDDDDYKNAQVGAFYGSLRLSQGDSVRTMQGLQLIGRAPTYGLTSTQERALRDLRINTYVPLGRLAIMREGTILTPDVWFDTNLYLAWFKNIIQSSIANLILRGELSLDAEGATIIKTRLENDCRLAVSNGMISPGQVSDETARAIANFTNIGEFDGMLPTGYYVAVRDPNTIPIEERPNRIGPATRIWLTGSNRIHNLPIGIFVTQ